MMRDFVSSEMPVVRNNDQFQVNIEGWAIYSVDTSYGEDADGNRGSLRKEVEDIEDLMCFESDGEDFFLKPDEIDRAKDILTHKFLEG